ncbi:MAG: hypothetical protein P4M09_22860 [Devosia sp.]|nr:hypothetical protein [Devosia sp.]
MARKATKKGIEEGVYRWLKVRVVSRNDHTTNVTYTLDIPGYNFPVTISEDSLEDKSIPAEE